MKVWAFHKQLAYSRRSVLWVVVGIAVAILIFVFGILPLVEAAKKADPEASKKS